jgi:transposase
MIRMVEVEVMVRILERRCGRCDRCGFSHGRDLFYFIFLE